MMKDSSSPPAENIFPLTTGDRNDDDEKVSILVKKEEVADEEQEPGNIQKEGGKEGSNKDPDDGPSKTQFALYMAVMWAEGFLINMIRVYPYVLSTDIQDRTGASTLAISTLFMIPRIVSIVLGLVTPSLFAIFGILGCNSVASIGTVISFAIVGLGISIENFWPVIVGTSLAIPLFSIQSFAIRMTTHAALPKNDYTQWSATGKSIMALGYTTSHLGLPHFDVEVGTWVVVSLTVLVAILSHLSVNQGFAMSKLRSDGGASPPSLAITDFGKKHDDDDDETAKEKDNSTKSTEELREGPEEAEDVNNKDIPEQPVATTISTTKQRPTSAMTRLTKDLQAKLSIEALLSFPAPYWNAALLGAFVSGFHAYADVFPNIYHRVHGLTSVEANQMASFNSISCMVAGPFAGWAFAHTGTKTQHGGCSVPSRGTIFIGACLLFVVSHLIPALFWAIWIGFYTIIVQGIGSAFLQAGANGIIPQILKAQPDAIASGYAWSTVGGRLFAVGAAQVCYHTFHHSYEIQNTILTITPGEFFMVGMAIVTTLLAVGYKLIDDKQMKEAAEAAQQEEGETSLALFVVEEDDKDNKVKETT